MDSLAVNLLRKRILLRAGLATVGTFLFNTLGVWLSLYSMIWWYDMPMHFAGGLFTALLIFVFLLRFSKFANLGNLKSILIVLFLTLIIGLLWEGYEIVFDIIAGRKHIFIDSLSDIFFDFAGGIQACFIYMRHKNKLTSTSSQNSL